MKYRTFDINGLEAKKIKGKVVGWIYTMLVVVISFVFFRSDNLIQAIAFLKGMFFGFNHNTIAMVQFQSFFNPYVIIIYIVSIIGIFNWKTRFAFLLTKKYVSGFIYVLSICCIYLCIMSLATNNYNPFIYFRF